MVDFRPTSLAQVFYHLIENDAAGNLPLQPLSNGNVTLGMVPGDVGRTHDLGPEGLEHVNFLVGHLLGHDDDATVAARGGGHGQADSGVAAGRLDYRRVLVQKPLVLGLLDHPVTDPVLD